MNNGNHGNKFFEGLIWGAVIGGAVVFLMGTKKGKKLLKAVTEEGMEGLTDLMEAGVEDGEEFAEDEEEMVSPRSNGVSEKEEVKEAKPSVRKRFFRRKSS